MDRIPISDFRSKAWRGKRLNPSKTLGGSEIPFEAGQCCPKGNGLNFLQGSGKFFSFETHSQHINMLIAYNYIYAYI